MPARRRGAARAAVAAGRFVTLPGGGRLHVLDEGPFDAPVVVLVHGMSCSLHWYAGVAARLRAAHRVVRMDLLGHGRSTRSDAGYGEQVQAAAVSSMLDGLGIDHVEAVAGHSYGADVAVELAASDERVRRVAVLGQAADMAHVAGLPAGVVRAAGRAAGVVRIVGTTGLADMTVRQAFARGFVHDEAFDRHGRVRRDARATAPGVYRHVMVDRVDRLAADGLDRRLARLDLPTLVVLGERDTIYPLARTRPRYDALRGAVVRVAEGSGHSVPVERPDVVVQHLRELVAVPSARATTPVG